VQELDKNGKPKRHQGKPVMVRAGKWLAQNRAVEQMTWAPGFPKLIRDRLVVDTGWIKRDGVACLNLYRPPQIELGDATKAAPWIELIRKIYPNDVDHIVRWCAQRVQRPQEKINHALVLGGDFGIGKDTLLAPLRYTIGEWNFHVVPPTALLGRFNSFTKSVVLQISEARDLGDADRFKFHDHTKDYLATPPHAIRVDEKHLREHFVVNIVSVVITTNHLDGLYLPPSDRRHYVAWSNRKEGDYPPGYWDTIWNWYQANDNDGFKHVAAYLNQLDLSDFNPFAPPPKTPAFWSMVHLGSAPEEAELKDVIEALGNPDALLIQQLIASADATLAEWMHDHRNQRALSHRLTRCNYVPVQGESDGRWKIKGKKLTIYGKQALSPAEQQAAAKKLASQMQ
jgi:Family of unknown function (DUF5906)